MLLSDKWFVHWNSRNHFLSVHIETYLREKLKPGVFGQSGVHVCQLRHGAQELDGLVVPDRLEEFVLTTDELTVKLLNFVFTGIDGQWPVLMTYYDRHMKILIRDASSLGA